MDISSGKALFISAVTGGPSLAVATFNGEFIPVATGIAVGTLMFWWSVRNTSNDQYIKSLHSRIQESQDDINEIQDANTKKVDQIQSTLTVVQIEVKRQKIILEQIQKQLTMHSCPTPSDPNAKCRLPEILGNTLTL
jgi:nitrogen fixation-related uncharacterized protein